MTDTALEPSGGGSGSGTAGGPAVGGPPGASARGDPGGSSSGRPPRDTSGEFSPPRMTHRQILVVYSGLSLGLLLGALDQTIVSTALWTIVIMPGQTWSLNATVGERTAANGFARGYTVKDGRRTLNQDGGTSQLATTMFNAAFFAGLRIAEYQPHGSYLSRYPEGREATTVWGSTDLKIRNDTPNVVYADTSYTRDTVTVTLWGAQRWTIGAAKSTRYNVRPPRTVFDPSPACEKQNPVAGFDVDVWRIFRDPGGREVRQERFHTRYAPVDRIICGPIPQTGPVASSVASSGAGRTISRFHWAQLS